MGSVMKTLRFAAAALALALVACASNPSSAPAQPAQAATQAEAQPPADPYLWLEDVDSARAMEWVNRENARWLPVLENDRRYQGLLASAMQIAQSHDRLPLGEA